MFILSQKLKHLKKNLKVSNKNVFGNIQNHVTIAEQEVQNIQAQIDTHGLTDTLLNQQKLAHINLDKALNKQEAFWKEKSKTNWHIDGDRNTAYFHRLAKIKTKTNLISSIRSSDQVITDPEQISEHISNHFKQLFSTNFSVLQDCTLVEEVIPTLVDDQTNNLLTLITSKAEIKNAVFSLNGEGAPGPDGFGGFFFQHYWSIVKLDVINAVKDFFINNWLTSNFNSNAIVLIPKTLEADTVGEYMPITLSNFKFKIITKVLAERLARIMPNLVSNHQRGFIQGRRIKDCICITSEAINILHNSAFGGNLALKIDIAKAFDTIEWKFLLRVLKAFNFNEKFCNWIEVILNSAHLSISINGKLHDFFSSARGGLGKVTLFPHFFFCLAEDVFSRV